MLDFLNPLKQAINALCFSLFCLVMGYTHSQAFKMGATVHQHPLLEKSAQILGILPDSPPEPAPEKQIPLLLELFDWLDREDTPDP
jgi:hypothetical protein